LTPPDEQQLAERLVAAEQDERRRIALELHDGPVQALSGIALMLDAAIAAIESGRGEEAAGMLRNALALHRDTIRSVRDLSFNLEPVVLRDQGFGPAVHALAERLAMAHRLQIDLDVDPADLLSEQAQAVLYQVLREALGQGVRRGPPTRIAVRIVALDDGSLEAIVEDDGASERRRASVEAIEERARPLGGRVRVEDVATGGTVVRVLLPPHRARG
jgi:two-component system sensor histidine kinase DegS